MPHSTFPWSPAGLNGPWSYALATDYDTAGAFYIAYCRNATSLSVNREVVHITPHGFLFRYTLFRDVEKMVTYFKQVVQSGQALPTAQSRQVRATMLLTCNHTACNAVSSLLHSACFMARWHSRVCWKVLWRGWGLGFHELCCMWGPRGRTDGLDWGARGKGVRRVRNPCCHVSTLADLWVAS